jgi:Tol biopolymer transport system component
VATRTLVWVDRQGRETLLSASLLAAPYAQPRVSPDGKFVAMVIGGQEGIWLSDIDGQMLRQLSGTESALFPVWTTDSHRLLFGRGSGGLFSTLADGTGKVQALNSARGAGMLPSGVTPDGTRVLFSRGARDVMAMALDTGLVESLVETPFDERNGVVSPDGRWLAYESKSTEEQFEIYVTPYPEGKGTRLKISTAGGTRPLWAPSGQELFFVAPDGAIMGVRVDSLPGVWRGGSPVKILGGLYATGAPASGRNYDISHDGKKFLMVKPSSADRFDAPQIELVQHWVEELKRLVPATP